MYSNEPDDYSGSEMLSDQEEDIIEIPRHVNASMFSNYQRVPIDIEITASPVDLQRNPSLCKWKIQPHISKQFKTNLALQNRNNPSEADLAGNLDRMLVIGFDVTMHGNTFPYAMGMDIPGMMKTNVHKHGACTYRLPPGLQMESTQKSIFDAENPVSEYAYRNYRMCTMEDLNEDIEFKKGSDKYEPHAMITVGTMAYETLTDSLKKGCWREEALTQEQIQHIFNPPTSRIEVTDKIGRDIHTFLKGKVEGTAKSLISVNDLVISVHRADGVRGFDTPKQIAGAINASAGGKVTATKVNMDALQRTSTFYVKGDLMYVLF